MPKETILIVDDEEDILELIRHTLSKEGYTVVGAATGETALKYAIEKPFDMILLDLMLPGLDGLEVAKRLKGDDRTRYIPIIMLTAKGEEADVVTGLELGADDYITKPFSPRVLLARMKAVIRRQPEPSDSADDMLRIHDLEIHMGRREVKAGGEVVDLTFTEFQVLFYLSKRPGWVLTRSQIVDAVRGNDYPVTDRSVDVQIVGLRKKLGLYGKYIETVRGVGYRFKERS
jgi:two-component system, OmpR family, alkaline phosphatase synthesis response regulator PhoP